MNLNNKYPMRIFDREFQYLDFNKAGTYEWKSVSIVDVFRIEDIANDYFFKISKNGIDDIKNEITYARYREYNESKDLSYSTAYIIDGKVKIIMDGETYRIPWSLYDLTEVQNNEYKPPEYEVYLNALYGSQALNESKFKAGVNNRLSDIKRGVCFTSCFFHGEAFFPCEIVGNREFYLDEYDDMSNINKMTEIIRNDNRIVFGSVLAKMLFRFFNRKMFELAKEQIVINQTAYDGE